MDIKKEIDPDFILGQERQLVFEKFEHHHGWELAAKILENYEKLVNDRKRSKQIGIRISLSNTVVFQYLMEKKKDDSWLGKKNNTVMKTAHSSMYVWAAKERNKEYLNIEKDDDCAVCGGGFPIRVNLKTIGSICVSGLAHEEDHQLIVDSIKDCAAAGVIRLMKKEELTNSGGEK